MEALRLVPLPVFFADEQGPILPPGVELAGILWHPCTTANAGFFNAEALLALQSNPRAIQFLETGAFWKLAPKKEIPVQSYGWEKDLLDQLWELVPLPALNSVTAPGRRTDCPRDFLFEMKLTALMMLATPVFMRL